VSSLLTLAVAGTSWAHVVVTPEEVGAEDYETFTVTVPTEKDIPTTEVRVEVPEGFTVSGVQPVPGWDYEFEEDGRTYHERYLVWRGDRAAGVPAVPPECSGPPRNRASTRGGRFRPTRTGASTRPSTASGLSTSSSTTLGAQEGVHHFTSSRTMRDLTSWMSTCCQRFT
jgi:Domain of unkown function (DUF1775)